MNNSPGEGITAAKKPRPRQQPAPDENITTTAADPAAQSLVAPVPSDAAVSAPQAIPQRWVTYTVPDDDGDPRIGAVEGTSQATVNFPKALDQAKVDAVMTEIRKLSAGEVVALAVAFDAYRAGLGPDQHRAAG